MNGIVGGDEYPKWMYLLWEPIEDEILKLF